MMQMSCGLETNIAKGEGDGKELGLEPTTKRSVKPA